jgi:prepilin signal peptidase PulO-like enzyme (type II secretory pathway)
VLRGKCRFCHKSIAISHPVVELLTGALFVWWYWFGFFFFQLTQAPYSLLQPVFWLFVGIVLLVIFVADWRFFIIPDGAVIALLSSTLLYRVLLVTSGVMQWQDFFNTLYSAFVATLFFFSLWFFTKGKGMGFGDVKVIGPLCLLMGWPGSIVGIFASFVMGAVVGVVLLTFGKKKLRQPIPFGPFLIAASLLSLVWGDALIGWYLGLMY